MPSFNKTVRPDQLAAEIQASVITVAVQSIGSEAGISTVEFKAPASEDELAILAALVEAHVPQPVVQPTPQVEVVQIPPSAAKTTADGKTLFKRATGIRQDVVEGENEIEWEVPPLYPRMKIMAIEVMWAHEGEFTSFKVFDTPTGLISKAPNMELNQFGFTVNVAAKYYRWESKFDADLFGGMKLRLNYTAVAAHKVGINFDVDEVKS